VQLSGVLSLGDELGVLLSSYFILTTECLREWTNSQVRFVIRVLSIKKVNVHFIEHGSIDTCN